MNRRLWGMTSGMIVVILLVLCLVSYKACSGCHKVKSMTLREFEDRIEYGMTKEEIKAEFGKPNSLAGVRGYVYRDIIVYEGSERKSDVLIFFDENRVINYVIQ